MKYPVFALIVLWAVSGCEQSEVDQPSNRLKLLVESPFPSDQSVVQSRAPNPNNLRLAVTINGNAAQTQRLSSDQYEVTGEFEGSTVALSVSWSELVNQRVLQLATFEDEFRVEHQAAYNIERSQYVSGQFDNDRDLDTNLEERYNGTSPFNSNQCSRCIPNVDSHVRRIPAAEAPVIDGQYDLIWNNAQFKDQEDNLFIRSLENDAGLDLFTWYPDRGMPPFRWASLHDAEFLYILVLGESTSDASFQTPYRDSGDNFLDDDAVGVTLASDGSGLTSEFEIELYAPLLDVNGNDNKTEFEVVSLFGSPESPANSTSSSAYEVAACVCTGSQSIWEIRIPLSGVIGSSNTSTYSLDVGSIFDMEVVVSDDVNAGSSDYLWGWPSESTSFGGRVVLQDFLR